MSPPWALLLTASTAAAPVAFRVSSTLSSSAVIQRDAPAIVWGFGTPGLAVAATLDGAPANTTRVGPDGVWRISFPAQPASTAPHALGFAQDDGAKATLEDILFGDVYLCGGQSNAQFTLPMADNGEAEVAAAANYPNIRVFSTGQVAPSSTMATPQTDLSYVNLTWTRATTPGAVGGYGNWTTLSAVCWLFGRTLFDALGGTVPLGLASVNWGGTDIQTWSSPDALAKCSPNPNRNAPGANANSSLWNARMAPFTTGPTAFAGALYYQGESNAPPFPIFTPGYYACALDALIVDWRAKLGSSGADMWFGVVQLAPFTAPAGYGYAEVRAEQTAALRNANASISTAVDHGDALGPWGTYHPRFKRPVGERLAAAALRLRYGRADGPAWLHPTAIGGADTTAPGSGTLTVRVDFEPGSVQGGGLAINASANPCPRDDLPGTPPYMYFSLICAGFTAVVGAPKGAPGLPSRFVRLDDTAIINGLVLEIGNFTLPQAAARCEALAAAGCVGFEAAGPPPSDNATVTAFRFRTLADPHSVAGSTAWVSPTPYGTYALPATAAVTADGVSLVVTAECGELCTSGRAELRGVTYAWGSWPVANLFAGSGMPALPFFVAFPNASRVGAPVRHY